jgi:signal transduction histidine kinase
MKAGMNPWVRAAVLLLVAQLLFWTCLAGAEWMARPDGAHLAPAVGLMLPDKHGRYGADLPVVKVPLTREPAYLHVDSAGLPTGRFVLTFQSDAPLRDRALYLGWMRRISEVQLNGHLLKGGYAEETWSLLGAYEPVSFALPAEFQVPGRNEIHVTMRGKGNKILPAWYIVAPAAAASAIRWGQLFGVELPVAAIGIMVFALALLAATRWPSADRLRARAVIVLLLGWIVHNLAVLDFFDFIPEQLSQFSVYALTYLFLGAILYFALVWGQASRRALYGLGIAVMLPCAVVAAVTTRDNDLLTFQVGFLIEAIGTITTGLVGAWFILRPREPGNATTTGLESLLFLFCLTAVVVDSVDDRWQISVPFVPDLPLTFYFAPACGVILALGLAAVIASQAARARVLAVSMNAELAARLAERSAELEASHARNRDYERQVTLAEERQRIVRDMHDGIGGQITALLLTARGGEISREGLIDSLQAAMDDLRLIVHSMETTGDTLGDALQRFRDRMEARLRQSGVTMNWQVEVDAGSVVLGPEPVLHIYRVLQECCSNAIRHGGATMLDFIVHQDPQATGSLVVTVTDNGAGFGSDANSAGFGLKSMQARARRMGGTIRFSAADAGKGASVRLEIPQNA